MQSENTAEQIEPGAAEAAAVEPVKLENLSALLDADTSPEGDTEKGAAVGNNTENAKPKAEMFNDLAESLGIELNDLYQLKVSTSDGKHVTIEDLKALQSTQDDIAIRELEFEETRVKKESDLRQAQNEIAEVVSSLPPGTIKPEILEKMRAKNATRTQVEQQRTLTAIPTWENEATRTEEMIGMSTHLERFGFPANYLGTVVDHRQMVFIRESFLREKRITNALAKVRAGKPNPTTQTKATGKAPGKMSGAKSKNSNARNGLESFFNDA